MYSGQQKFETSSCTPLPPTPPVASPKPCPRAPVSVFVTPGCGSSCEGLGGGGRLTGALVGTTSSRGLGAGKAGRGGSGVGSGIARPPIGVIPPARGPGAPDRLIVITVAGVSSAETPQSKGPKIRKASAPRCAAIDHTTIARNGSACSRRATMTSVTSVISNQPDGAGRGELLSLFPRKLRDDANILNTGFLQSIEDLHELLQVHLAVAAKVDELVRACEHHLLHAFGEEIQAHGLLVDEHASILAIGRRQIHKEPVARNFLRAARNGQVHFDPSLQHGRRDHENDEQDEHHVDHRDDVDFSECGRDAPAALMTTAGVRRRCHDLRHKSYVKLRS